MGNCMDLFISSSTTTTTTTTYTSSLPNDGKIRVVLFNGDEEEFVASTSVGQITSGPYNGYKLVHHSQPHLSLSSDTKLVCGEIYYLLPELKQSFCPPITQKIVEDDGCGGRTIKIIVTKKQLEELLFITGGLKGLLSGEDFLRIPGMENSHLDVRSRKWKPSLDTIPESAEL